MSQRDSGLGEDIGHNRTTQGARPSPIPSENEESDTENPGNETFYDPEGGDSTSGSDDTPEIANSESSEEDVEQQLPAMANQPASGSQLNSIPKFEGKEGLEVRNFIEAVESAKTQFQWNNDTAISSTIYRLSGPAQDWMRGKKMMGDAYAGAEGWTNLKRDLLERFSPVINSATAVDAVRDLKQHHDETASEFYDRIIHSLDRKNHAYTAAQKREEAYLTAFRADLVTFFLGGLKESISKKVMGVPNPPDTPAGALQAARAAEAAEARQNIPIMAVQEHQEDEVQVDAVQRRKNQCFNCQGFGHWARDCPSPRTRKQGSGQSRGGAQGQTGNSDVQRAQNNPYLRQPANVLIGGKRPQRRVQAADVGNDEDERGSQWDLEETQSQSGNE